jgi:putative ABC transport system ATP-binding protein
MITCEGLVKIFKTDDLEVVALQGLNLHVDRGELMAIIGSSGSGKSTLLNILGGLDRPSAGQVRVGDWDLLKMSDAQLVEYKRKTVGFVWQNNARNLLPYLTALENVELPMMLHNLGERSYAAELLDWVGLSARKHSKTAQLSGGEQQRVAIAIALANRPALLLADEPTGSVDTATAELIMNIFRRLNEELGLTVVIVTHDRTLAGKVNRVVAIRDGMTSTEFIREFGGQQEFVVLDRAGRLQVPREYLESLGVGERVTMQFDGERIVITAPKIKGGTEDESS